jgi:hypothetical protein
MDTKITCPWLSEQSHLIRLSIKPINYIEIFDIVVTRNRTVITKSLWRIKLFKSYKL